MNRNAPCSWTPEAWRPDSIPDVDDVRPRRCPACRCPWRVDGRIVLHGHGVRVRGVVVPPASTELTERHRECWARRYRCTACGAVPTVLPRGVMRRYLYSVGAILVALFLSAVPPIGDGLSHADAYARQGMYAVTAWRDACAYRWRSLDRWAQAAVQWWPDAVVGGVAGLLVGFRERADSEALAAWVEVGVRSHVQWEDAMRR